MTNLAEYFRQSMNHRRVHIAELQVTCTKLPPTAAKQLAKRIQHEKHQLRVLESIWNVR